MAGAGGLRGGKKRVQCRAVGLGDVGRRRRGCCCPGRWRGRRWRRRRCCRRSRSAVWGWGPGGRRWALSLCSTWGGGGELCCGLASQPAPNVSPPCGTKAWLHLCPPRSIAVLLVGPSPLSCGVRSISSMGLPPLHRSSRWSKLHPPFHGLIPRPMGHLYLPLGLSLSLWVNISSLSVSRLQPPYEFPPPSSPRIIPILPVGYLPPPHGCQQPIPTHGTAVPQGLALSTSDCWLWGAGSTGSHLPAQHHTPDRDEAIRGHVPSPAVRADGDRGDCGWGCGAAPGHTGFPIPRLSTDALGLPVGSIEAGLPPRAGGCRGAPRILALLLRGQAGPRARRRKALRGAGSHRLRLLCRTDGTLRWGGAGCVPRTHSPYPPPATQRPTASSHPTR